MIYGNETWVEKLYELLKWKNKKNSHEVFSRRKILTYFFVVNKIHKNIDVRSNIEPSLQ